MEMAFVYHVYSKDIYLDMSLFNHIVPFASVLLRRSFLLSLSLAPFVNLENLKGKNDFDGHEFYPFFRIIPLNDWRETILFSFFRSPSCSSLWYTYRWMKHLLFDAMLSARPRPDDFSFSKNLSKLHKTKIIIGSHIISWAWIWSLQLTSHKFVARNSIDFWLWLNFWYALRFVCVCDHSSIDSTSLNNLLFKLFLKGMG